MSHSLYDMDPGPECPEIVRMIVEIPKNSSNKYEYDGKLQVFVPEYRVSKSAVMSFRSEAELAALKAQAGQ